MDVLLDNRTLLCRGCHNYLSPPVKICNKNLAHNICGKCIGKHDECVICGGKFTRPPERIQEAFMTQSYPCKFFERGCIKKLLLREKENHEVECNFKLYKCDFSRYCYRNCEWEGPYSAIEEHFRTHVRSQFSSNPVSIQMRIPGNSFNFMQLIRAHNELFWFKYRIDGAKQKVYFIFQIIGTKQKAAEYSYEFEIISLIDAMSAVHFTEKCFSESENVLEIYDAEKCAVTSFSKLSNFIVDNKLNFTYEIKKMKQFEKNKGAKNTCNAQKNNVEAKGSKPQQHKRRQRGKGKDGREKSQHRGQSSNATTPKKVQNTDFEILDLKDLKKELPQTNRVNQNSQSISNSNQRPERSNQSDNFQSVFLEKASPGIPVHFYKNNTGTGMNYQQNFQQNDLETNKNMSKERPNNLYPTMHASSVNETPSTSAHPTPQQNYTQQKTRHYPNQNRLKSKEDNCVVS